GVSVTPYSKLLTAAKGESFGEARVGAAGHLEQGFVAGITPTQATLYGQLASLPSAESYRLALDNLSGETLHAAAVAAHAASLSFSERMNSCPVLDTQTDLTHEQTCAWGRAIDNRTDRSTTSDAAGYTSSARTLQAGGQLEVGNGWLVGGSLAFDSSSVSPRDTGGRIDGHSTSVGVVVKREAGAWLFSGGVDYGSGQYDSQRAINIGTIQANATGNFDMSHVGLHGRVAYRMPQDGWYAKPYVDLHAVRMHTGAFTETGAGDFDLNVQSAHGTLYTLSPMLEFGTRRQLDSGYTLHGFVAAGALLHNGDAFGAPSSMQGMAASGATPFQASAELPRNQAKVNLGVDIGWKQSTLRLEYGGEYGRGYRSNTATVRMNVLF
ncbi:MAG: autotransporter outer membrane beta-barrel domain-containing protein, partial [Solirubrobacteraceae bacterium]|nr:autotransporter outer membrane beta-barrel domain-containing protein [Solirubrobacteraceae bacterium]